MSTLTSLPPISTLPSLPTETRTQILDLLFEPSPALHTLSLPLTSASSTYNFPSYADLVIAIGMQLTELAESSSASDTEWLEKVLASHPRLGEKKVDSAMSRMEQAAMRAASAGAGAGTGEDGQEEGKRVEEETLRMLNREYEETFPGLRYVVFVNGRARSVIFEDMRRRIQRGDIGAERREAIQAMCDIARDRVGKLGAE